MSCRHSSYRKLKKAVDKANAQVAATGEPDLTRSEMNRVLHWSRQRCLPKPYGWGRPKGWRG
ncbi:hypothetical protein [Streptomyces roseolus]|uniref:hypothetical protein n=1 Tax=Streptomyces roseolus TaxID=67358 RepID=UPI0036484CF4